MGDLRPAGGGPARLIDVVQGRSGRVVAGWLAERGQDWQAGVQVAALDPFRGYERALAAGLPEATVVLDAFHAGRLAQQVIDDVRRRVQLAQQVIDDVRRRVQHDTLGHRGRKDDPLYGIRRLLLRGAAILTATAYGRMMGGLDAGDRGEQVAAAWIACQELRHVYTAPTLAAARRRLNTFYWARATPDVPDLHRLGRTIAAWQNELLAYFTTAGASNGPTEASIC